MKKQLALVFVLLLLAVTAFGCSQGAQQATKPTPAPSEPTAPEGPSVTTEPSEPFEIYPGYVSREAILEGIAKWASHERGIEKDTKTADLSAYFATDDAKQYIRDYTVVSLTDGSLYGYVEFVEEANVEHTDQGDVVSGENCDFVNAQVEALARSMGLESRTQLHSNCVFFAVSEDPTYLISYYFNCREGNIDP